MDNDKDKDKPSLQGTRSLRLASFPCLELYLDFPQQHASAAAVARKNRRCLFGPLLRRKSLALLVLLATAVSPVQAQQPDPLVCNRTPQVRDVIVDRVVAVSHCANVTDVHLAGIAGLDLSGRSIATLQEGDFAGLTVLKALSLDGNGLTALPEGVFSGLTALVLLDLSINSLTALPRGVFSGLTALKTLLLDGNPGSEGFRPIANAGADQTAGAAQVVTLTATASEDDPWGDNVSYAWTRTDNSGSVLTLMGAETASPNFVMPAGATGLEFELKVTGRGGDRFVGTASLKVRHPVAVVTLTGPGPVATTDIVEDSISLVYTYSAADLHDRVLAGKIKVAAAVDGDAVTPTINIDGARGEITIVLEWKAYPNPEGHLLAVTLSLGGAADGFVLGDPNSITTPFSFLPFPPTRLEVRQAEGNQDKQGAAASDTIELGYSFDYAAGNRLKRPRSGLAVQVDFEFCPDATASGCSSLAAASRILTLDGNGSLTLRIDRTLAGLSVFGEADGDSIRHGRVLLSTAGDESFVATVATTRFSFVLPAAPSVCDRTQQVRDAIVDKVAAVSHCAYVTDAHLAGIGGLNLSGISIATLQEGDFAGLTALKRLYLDHNSLMELPMGVFAGLTALTRLYLDHNSLEELPRGVFSGLTALKFLSLEGNPGSEGFRPIANAGADQTAGAGQVVTLTATASDEDPWGDNVSYAWRRTDNSGSSLTLMGAETASPSFVMPAGATELEFELRVTGRGGPFVGTASLKVRHPVAVVTLTGPEPVATTDIVEDSINLVYTYSAADLHGRVLAGKIKVAAAIDGVAVTPAINIDGARGEITIVLEWKAYPNPEGHLLAVTLILGVAADGFVLGDPSSITTPFSFLPFPPTRLEVRQAEGNQDKQGASDTIELGYSFDYAADNRLTRPRSGLAVQVDFELCPDATASGCSSLAAASRILTLDGNGSLTLRIDRTLDVLSLFGEADDDAIRYGRVLLSTAGDESFVATVATTSFSFVIPADPSVCDRTPQVRDAIVEVTAAVSHCAYVTDVHLADIFVLNLSNSSIATLQGGDFAGLTTLSTLLLGFNSLTVLPEGVFAGLTDLHYLSLHSNTLTTLSADVFSGLTALNFLNLSNNNLTALPGGIFSSLTTLSYLFPEGNPAIEGFSPIANAGADQTAGAGQVVTLTATASDDDPWGDNVSYAWTRTDNSGSVLTLMGARTASPSFVMPAGATGLEFELRVTGRGGFFAATASLKVRHPVAVVTLTGPEPVAATDIVGDSINLVYTYSAADLHGRVLAGKIKVAAAVDGDAVTPTINIDGARGEITIVLEREAYPNPGGHLLAVTLSLGAAADGFVLGGPSSITTPFSFLPLPPTRLEVRQADGNQDKQGASDTIELGYSFDYAAGNRLDRPRSGLAVQVDFEICLDATASGCSSLAEASRILTLDGNGSLTLRIDRTLAGLSVFGEADGDAIRYGRVLLSTAGDESFVATVATTSFSFVVPADPSVCDRTPQVRDEIVDKVVAVSHCAYVTDVHLAGLVALNLSERSIATLQGGDFAGLTALARLDLSNNSLTVLPEGVFAGLPALARLDLSNNSLTVLPEGVFAGLPALARLDLSNNSLTVLPEGVFAGLPDLLRLSLQNNSLRELPMGVFAGLPDLLNLLLYNNSLTELPLGVFAGLPDLQALSLEGNDLTALPEDVFAGLPALRLLNLSNNSLTALPGGVFSGLTALNYLLPEGNPGSEGFRPIANAGADQTAGAGQVVTLTATASEDDPWGDNVSYAWTRTDNSGSVLTLMGAETASLSFVMPAGATGLEFELRVTGRGGDHFVGTASLKVRHPVAVVTLTGPKPVATTDIVGDSINLVYTYSAADLHGRVLAGKIKVAAAVDGDAVTPTINIDGARGEITVVLAREAYPHPGGHLLAVTLSLSAAADGFVLGGPSSITTPFSFLPLPPTRLEVRQADGNQDKQGAAASDTIELGYSFDYAADNRLNRPRSGLAVQVDFELCPDATASGCSSLAAASRILTLDGNGSLTLRIDRTLDGLSVFGEADDDSIRYGRVLLSTAGDESFVATAATTSFSFVVPADPSVCGRTPQVRDAIVDSVMAVSHCAYVTDAHLADIFILNLSGSSIATLQGGDFAGLTALGFLNLNNNSLMELPMGVFAGLTDLLSLNLHNNNLMELSADVFSGLPNLQILKLGDNKLTSTVLPAGVFSELPALKTLSLEGNGLTALPEDVFAGLPALKTLSLEGNGLTALPEDVFAGLPDLHYLYLQNNSLTVLPAGVFSELPALKTLSLEGNGLTALPEGVFAGLTDLHYLYLQNNSLTLLPAGVFSELPDLQVLSLDGNPGIEGFRPIANAGADQTAGAGQVVTLTATASEDDPWGDNVSYAWRRTDDSGSVLTLMGADAASLSFVMPAGATGLEFELRVTGRGGPFVGTASLKVRHPVAVVTLTGPGPVATTDIVGDSINLVYTYSAADLHGRVLAGKIKVAAAVDGDAVTPSINIDGARGEITIVLERDAYLEPDGHLLAVTLSLGAAADGFVLGETSSITTPFSFLPLPPTRLEVRQAEGNQDKQGAAASDTIELGYSFDYAADNRLNRPRSGLAVQVDFELCPDATASGCSSLAAASRILTLDGNGSLTLRIDRTLAGLSVFGEADDDSIRYGRVLLSTAGDESFVATAATTSFSFVVPADPSVCDRTQQVRDAIVDKVVAVSHCAYVTDAHLAGIGALDLSGSSIATLQEGDFAGLTALKGLYLDDNSLMELPLGVFAGLPLEGLYLHSNNLMELSADVFSGLPNLQILKLGDNSLTSTVLPAGVFSELPALKTLSLEGNGLMALPEGIFAGLTDLHYLYLQNNSLTVLPAGVFSELPDLKVLSLDGNPGIGGFRPIANAGADQTAGAGQVVTLTATASDEDPWGDNVSYAWRRTDNSGSALTLMGAETASPSFVMPAGATGLEFELRVTGRGGSFVGTASLKVRHPVAVVTLTGPGPVATTDIVGDSISLVYSYSADNLYGRALTGSIEVTAAVDGVAVTPAIYVDETRSMGEITIVLKRESYPGPGSHLLAVTLSLGAAADGFVLGETSSITTPFRFRAVDVLYEVVMPDTDTIVTLTGPEPVATTDIGEDSISLVYSYSADNLYGRALTGSIEVTAAVDGDAVTPTINIDGPRGDITIVLERDAYPKPGGHLLAVTLSLSAAADGFVLGETSSITTPFRFRAVDVLYEVVMPDTDTIVTLTGPEPVATTDIGEDSISLVYSYSADNLYGRALTGSIEVTAAVDGVAVTPAIYVDETRSMGEITIVLKRESYPGPGSHLLAVTLSLGAAADGFVLGETSSITTPFSFRAVDVLYEVVMPDTDTIVTLTGPEPVATTDIGEDSISLVYSYSADNLYGRALTGSIEVTAAVDGVAVTPTINIDGARGDITIVLERDAHLEPDGHLLAVTLSLSAAADGFVLGETSSITTPFTFSFRAMGVPDAVVMPDTIVTLTGPEPVATTDIGEDSISLVYSYSADNLYGRALTGSIEVAAAINGDAVTPTINIDGARGDITIVLERDAYLEPDGHRLAVTLSLSATADGFVLGETSSITTLFSFSLLSTAIAEDGSCQLGMLEPGENCRYKGSSMTMSVPKAGSQVLFFELSGHGEPLSLKDASNPNDPNDPNVYNLHAIMLGRSYQIIRIYTAPEEFFSAELGSMGGAAILWATLFFFVDFARGLAGRRSRCPRGCRQEPGNRAGSAQAPAEAGGEASRGQSGQTGGRRQRCH